MSDEKFCEMYSAFHGDGIDHLDQLVQHTFTGEELKEFIEFAIKFKTKYMGIRSTYYVEKKLAIDIIVSKVSDCTVEQLERILEIMDETELRNFYITKNNPLDRERTILTVYDF